MVVNLKLCYQTNIEELGINPSVFFDLENRDPLYERNFHPIDHSEIECIMLYDSGKFVLYERHIR